MDWGWVMCNHTQTTRSAHHKRPCYTDFDLHLNYIFLYFCFYIISQQIGHSPQWNWHKTKIAIVKTHNGHQGDRTLDWLLPTLSFFFFLPFIFFSRWESPLKIDILCDLNCPDCQVGFPCNFPNHSVIFNNIHTSKMHSFRAGLIKNKKMILGVSSEYIHSYFIRVFT